MKYLLIFICSGLALLFACRTPLRIPVHSQPSVLLDLRKEPVADSLSVVSILTIDRSDQSVLGNTVVVFTKSVERSVIGVITGLDGTAERRLRPGLYDLEARFTGKQVFMQEKLLFEAGYRYQISIGMGDSPR